MARTLAVAVVALALGWAAPGTQAADSRGKCSLAGKKLFGVEGRIVFARSRYQRFICDRNTGAWFARRVPVPSENYTTSVAGSMLAWVDGAQEGADDYAFVVLVDARTGAEAVVDISGGGGTISDDIRAIAATPHGRVAWGLVNGNRKEVKACVKWCLSEKRSVTKVLDSGSGLYPSSVRRSGRSGVSWWARDARNRRIL